MEKRVIQSKWSSHCRPLIAALWLILFCFSQTELNAQTNTAYTGMRNISSLQLTADMGTGWNLGNTLDATGGETSWGNPVTTKAMIDKVRAQGFKTIRIPTTWGPYVGGSPNYTIDGNWLNRVETVCNYAFANGMYVILNTHHEGDWCKPTYAQESAVKAKLVAIWTQIANRFKNYGDYLIFETLNEPRLEGSAEEWTGGTAEGRDVVNRLNKAALDAIRATGGNNASRFIMCPPYAAAGIGTAADAFVVPNNDSRVIVSVHNYSPYSFALQEPGTSTFGSSDRSVLDSEMLSYYNRWVSGGRAVVIGEWGTINKENTSARASHATYFVQVAKSRQLPVVLWDNGFYGQYGMAQLNRTGLSWYYPDIVNAITSQFSGSCTPTAITPYMQVGGTWTQTSSATVASGATVILGPQPTSGGSWSWSGMASGTSREVTLTPTSSGTATATYTNASGCQSTQVFTITVSGGSTSYVTIRNRATNLLIDGMGRTSAGSTCGQYASSGSWNQMWTLETSGAYVYIKNRNTGLYIDGRGNTTNGAFAGQWTSSTSNNLQWQQETAGSYVKFKNRATGLYLDGMGNTTNGADLGQWASSTSNNQQWTVSAVTSGTSFGAAEEVSSEKNDGNVSLSPNPFATDIKVSIRDPKVIRTIAMFDLTGKQVEVIEHENVKTEQTMGTLLNPGFYVIQINGVNSRHTFKVIKK
jgi:endoglucanase